MSKTHQAKRIIFILGLFNKFFVIPAVFVNEFEHFQYTLIGPTVEWSPKGIDPCGNRCKDIAVGATDDPHCGGRAGFVRDLHGESAID